MNQKFTYQWLVPSFDALVEQFAVSPLSFTENEALKSSHWNHGEDARLREDARFRPTPWGRWILASHLLANDTLYRLLRDADRSELILTDALTDLQQVLGKPLMFCRQDPRFVYEHEVIRLAATELSNRPKLESPVEFEKYLTHLPLHTLAAVAASEPAGEWGPRAQEEMVETLGWIRVRLPGHRLNDRMFVAQIKGHSMNNGQNGMTDGAYAVFQLWPQGTRQGKSVLVRGAFTDPETGAYALKKYIGDVRDAEGLHHAIHLVSLNPDKERYPDIVLRPEQDSQLTVVAEWIAQLAPADYGREPKPLKRQGRRDLTSPESHEKIADRLKNATRKFFEGSFKEHEVFKAGEESKTAWTARFICLDAAAGALHIEAGPLVGLPSFAKKLRVASGAKQWDALASNFRTKTWRIAFPPSTEPYHWSAPGFEDVLAEEFTIMGLDGLSATSVSIFRVDAAGTGLALTGRTLTPGQSYRLLVPPSLSLIRLPEPAVFPLGEGWRLWELALPDAPDVPLCTILESMQLGMGKSEPCMTWVIVPPALYRQAPSGESYPCFTVGQAPILHIRGMQQVSEDEVAVFLSGPGQLQTIPLPRGDTWTIELPDLEQGNYMVEVLFESTGVEPSRLPFAIDDTAVRSVNASVTAVVEGVSYDIHQLGSVVARGEFAWLEGMDVPIELTGPPLWPVSVTWKSGKVRRLKLAALRENGCLDIEQVQTLTEELRSICKVANLIVGCRELGRLTLQLDRKTVFDDLVASLKHLVLDQGQTAETLAGQFSLLRSVWLDPLLRLMNYDTGEIDPSYLVDAPPGTTALNLFETSRTPEGDVQKELRRVLILTGSTSNLQDMTNGSPRAYAEALCWKCGVVEALISDGLRWSLHKRGIKLRSPIWDMRKLSNDEATFDMDAFLSSCAVGV
jgi:hypothetical protein